jgi:RNA-dependent RNA polymerase
MGKTIQLYGFPSSVTAEEVRAYLEQRTGAGTVYAVKVRNKNGGQRACAIIQFTTTSEAEYIIALANPRLWYGRSYLKARQLEHDIVPIPRPRTSLHNIKDITLHFGCQISKKKFLILWKAVNVSVNFGIGMRKLHFSLSHNYVEYRLELSYENVWQIELHHPRNQTAKYLLIQVAHSTFD